MITFFGLVALVGFLLFVLDFSSRTSDSIPTELSGHGGVGLLMVLVGFVGMLCAKFFA